MARRIHANQKYITASQFADLTGMHQCTVRDWANKGLVRAKINPTKRKRMAYVYNLSDVKEVAGFN